MIKVFAIAFSTLICSILLKNKQPLISMSISIIGVILIIGGVISQVIEIKNSVTEISSSISGIAPYILLMFKVLIIVILTQILADICRDNGESALASVTEISSKIIVVAMILPLFSSVVSIVLGFVK